jgi:hypothetical protein
MRGTLTELHWSRAVQYFDAVGMLLCAADAAFAASAGQSIGGPALMAALLAKPQLVGMQALPHLHRDSLAHVRTRPHQLHTAFSFRVILDGAERLAAVLSLEGLQCLCLRRGGSCWTMSEIRRAAL